MPPDTTEARFRARVQPEPYSDCVRWNGSRSAEGYGRLLWGGRVRRAHQVAHELYIGPIPDGLLVLHTCGNAWCVNPGHLTVGTLADRHKRCRCHHRDHDPPPHEQPATRTPTNHTPTTEPR